jgi:hypothetical protein
MSYTKPYAVPEVKSQNKRGVSAAVIFLGCVFIEMVAALASRLGCTERQTQSDLREQHLVNSSLSADLEETSIWFDNKQVPPDTARQLPPRSFLNAIPWMMKACPD